MDGQRKQPIRDSPYGRIGVVTDNQGLAVATLPELTMWIRTGDAATRPRSIANEPTPASRLPQFCRPETVAWSTPTCRNR